MSKKILVIEDDKVIRENINILLNEEGYIARAAKNGEEALLKVKEDLPDLVLCDIKMPGMDGYEILEKFSMDILTNSIPFIFLTAKVEKENIRKAMKLGAVDYLIKPFDSDKLLKSIEDNLKKTKADK